MNGLVFKYIGLQLFPNPLPWLVLLPSAGWLSAKYRSKKTDALLLMTLCIVPVSLVTVHLIGYADLLAPLKYDQFFYAIDVKLGNPTYRIATYLAAHATQQALIDVVYNLLPYELVAVFAMTLWEMSIKDAWGTAKTIALLYALILPLYLQFPAVGPLYAFPGFPYTPPSIAIPRLMVVHGAPNCMPSGHFAMSLVTIWQARRWLVGIILGVIFSAFTAVATLGTGQHYLIDLIGAVPYAVLIVWLTTEPKHVAFQ